MYCTWLVHVSIVSSFEDTAKVEGTRKGEVASEWRLNPHFSFILTSRTSSNACRISHQYLFREQLHWHWSREEKRTCDVCIHIHLLESRRGKATYSMIGCLNQSVLPSSSAPAFLSNPCPVAMHSSGLPLTSVHDSRVELIRWSCTSNIYPSLIFSQSNYQPNARKSLRQRKAQTYVSSNVFCVLSVLTTRIHPYSYLSYIPITKDQAEWRYLFSNTKPSLHNNRSK